MKKLILFSLIFSSQMVLAEAVLNCSPLNDLSDNVQNIQDVNCEEINKNGQCKEAPPVDKEAMKKKIEGLLNFTTDPARMHGLKTAFDQYLKSNPWAQKFYAPRNNYDRERRTAPVPILDWFADPAFAELAKTPDEYKKGFIEKYASFAEKMDCTPTFKASSNYVESHPTIEEFRADKMGREQREFKLRNMRKDMADPKNVQALKERLQKIADESPNAFYICSTKPELEARTIVANRIQPCAGNFKKNFANNKFDVSTAELGKLLATPEAKEVSECIKDRLAKGAKLHHVSINSSASSLNNTGEAASRFCKKGFLGLSQARAETAKTKILPALFSQAGQTGFDISTAKVDINAAGANGDGTTGACVYEMKNGKEVLKPYYNTKAGQAELEDSKYVKVQVTFEDNTKKVSDSIPTFQPMYRCKKIEFKCE